MVAVKITSKYVQDFCGFETLRQRASRPRRAVDRMYDFTREGTVSVRAFRRRQLPGAMTSAGRSAFNVQRSAIMFDCGEHAWPSTGPSPARTKAIVKPVADKLASLV